MTIFCPILTAHNTDCISLNSLVQNTIMSYVLISFVIVTILKYTKSKSKPINLLKDYYLKHKFQSFVIDIIYTGFVFSLTFLLFRIASVELYVNRQVNISPFALYTTILSIMILVGSMLTGVLVKYGSSPVKSLKEWAKYGWKALVFDLVFFNIVSMLGFVIMTLGYSNIVIPPVYVGLALKFML